MNEQDFFINVLKDEFETYELRTDTDLLFFLLMYGYIKTDNDIKNRLIVLKPFKVKESKRRFRVSEYCIAFYVDDGMTGTIEYMLDRKKRGLW